MRNMRNWMLALAISCGMSLCGCSVAELEDRGFPLAIAIDATQEGMTVSFDFPNLAEASDGKSMGGGPVSLSVEGGSYYQAQKAYENNTNKVLDYSHLKAIILSDSLLSDDAALREFLAWLEGEESLARNICLFATEGAAAEILTLTERTETSVGNYLEQMVETQQDFRERKVASIGALMNQWHNQNELLLLPVLSDNGGIPSITSYLAMDGFERRGSISVEDAMQSFLCQGLLKGMTYRLREGAVVTLERPKAQLGISRQQEGALITVRLKGSAVLRKKPSDEQLTDAQLRRSLNGQLSEQLEQAAERLSAEPGIDITNSFYRLGGHDRELYRRYLGDYRGYQQQAQFQFECDFQVGSE